MIRTTISGNVIEKSKFWVGAAARPRGKRTAPTTRRKQDQNDRDAVKRLARSINCNFGYKDLLVTLEYDAAGFAAVGGDHGAAGCAACCRYPPPSRLMNSISSTTTSTLLCR